MLSVGLVLDGEGCVSSLRMEGHMDGEARGANLACAAASILARTAWESLRGVPGLSVEGLAAHEGSLDLRVGCPRAQDRDLVKGISLFLVRGLEGLDRDAPGSLKLEIKRIRRDSHGGQERQWS